MQDVQYPLTAHSRASHPAMSASASSPFPSYPDPSAQFSFPALPSKPSFSISRQPSVDPSFLFSSSFLPLSRQVSLSAFQESFEATEPFNFPSFDGELQSFKADAEAFDLISRGSSFDSDVSSWASNDDGYSAPRSPQSSVDSLSDSSQSDAELYTPYLTSAPYSTQDHWTQQRQAASLPLKTEEAQVGVAAGSQPPHSPVPVLPLPFHQPVYAFNYHSAEDEPAPQSHSSRHERREGLRGGGDSRHEASRSSSYLHLRPEGGDLYAASAASTQPSLATSSAASSSDAISPKSLLLSLSRTAASSSAQSSSHATSHFSPSSSSSTSSTSVTSIHLHADLDPNEVVIGIYTRAERAAKIARYREKRANRQWRKKILYGCRKSFADNRPRVGGRFIKMKAHEAADKEGGQ